MIRNYKILSTRQTRVYRISWAVYIIIAILLLVARYSASSDNYLRNLINGHNGSYHYLHPIENLIIKKRAQFEALQARQSKTLTQATHEYERRYGRSPPLGFDVWFQLAQENDFVLIDEFDTMMKSMEPFHGIPVDVLQKRMAMVEEMTENRVTPLKIQDGVATMESVLFFGEGQLPNATWIAQIPYNMTVLMNAFDEAMVSAPWDEVQEAVSKSTISDQQRCIKHPDTIIKPLIDSSQQDGWSATSQSCPSNSPARQFECPTSHEIILPHFIENATSSKDVCQNCHLRSTHGVLLAPETMRLAHDLVPIWSASKPSHFQDILVPSPYYDAVRDDYDITLDSDWFLKKNQFYWAGSATGGHATMKTWDKMQRQRLVLTTNSLSVDPIDVLQATTNGGWTTRTTTLSEASRFFDTKITELVQIEQDALEVAEVAFNLFEGKPKDPREAAYAYKFVLDIDGNAFSGRYYRLLQSKSVVVKQTIFQEWHDDRLIPWVHYVPLSTGFEELPEIASFLAGSERGLTLAERIAKESTEWHDKALRPVDLRLVTLRMLLEYGRLMNPLC